MSSVSTSSAFSPTPGLRVRLTDTSLFVTIVPYQLGDLGTVLQPCAMSGLWWVAFDRDHDNPMRLPVTAFASAGLASTTRPDTTEPAGLLDDLEPVPEDALAPHDSATLRSGVPLDALSPAAPVRQQRTPPSHAGDARLAHPDAQQSLRALDDLH